MGGLLRGASLLPVDVVAGRSAFVAGVFDLALSVVFLTFSAVCVWVERGVWPLTLSELLFKRGVWPLMLRLLELLGSWVWLLLALAAGSWA